MHSEQFNELAQALAKAQGTMKPAVFNRTNPHFKSRYADLSSIFEASREPLSANALSVVQAIEERNGGGLMLVAMLLHPSGQWMKSCYPLPANAKPQEFGSALTYARRYTYAALVGVVADEDDDGNGAEKGAQKRDDGTAITDEQVQEISLLLIETKSSLPLFLKTAKIESLTQLPADKFEGAKNYIRDNAKKRDALAAKGAQP